MTGSEKLILLVIGNPKIQGVLKDHFPKADFFEITVDIVRIEYPSDDILKIVASNQKSEIASDDDDKDDSDEPVQKPTNKDMVKGFQTIRHGLEYLENVSKNIFNALNKYEICYEKDNFVNRSGFNYLVKWKFDCILILRELMRNDIIGITQEMADDKKRKNGFKCKQDRNRQRGDCVWM
ncbi:hypothetical protein QE152_g26990 [Popillia japonica]|uniref:Uncharacterized protein n=1 Tax=Popillia japonica TaxID=7064 RepID=A0AAW1JWE1_POPJA